MLPFALVPAFSNNVAFVTSLPSFPRIIKLPLLTDGWTLLILPLPLPTILAASERASELSSRQTPTPSNRGAIDDGTNGPKEGGDRGGGPLPWRTGACELGATTSMGKIARGDCSPIFPSIIVSTSSTEK